MVGKTMYTTLNDSFDIIEIKVLRETPQFYVFEMDGMERRKGKINCFTSIDNCIFNRLDAIQKSLDIGFNGLNLIKLANLVKDIEKRCPEYFI